MRLALYARVSTQKQADKDLSIPDQLLQMRDYCKRGGHQIVAEYREEGASATTDRRPMFQEMVGAIECGGINADGILALTSSRLFRNSGDSIVWRRRLGRKGVRFYYTDRSAPDAETPQTRLLDGMAALFDEHTSEMIGWHTQRGMRENARRGYWNGNKPPYGYFLEKVTDERGNPKRVLRPLEEEGVIVRRIFELYTKNLYGGVEIAKILNADGVFRRQNKCTGKRMRWGSVEVLRVIENPVYMGTYYFNQYNAKEKCQRPKEEWIPLKVEPLVSESVFEAAQKLRVEKNPVKQQGRIHTGPLLLTGLLHCGHCGGQMVSAGAKKGDKIYRYYACKANMKSGKCVCPGCRVRAEEFEAAVLKQVLDWAFSLVNVRETLKAVRKALAERSKPIRALRGEADEISAKLAHYYEAFESGAMDAKDVGDRLKELRLAQKRIEGEIQSRAAVESLPEHLNRPETIIKAQREFRALFENGSLQLKRRYLNIVLERIEVKDGLVTLTARSAGIVATLENAVGWDERGVAAVISSNNKWQPVGDLNPCERTENPPS